MATGGEDLPDSEALAPEPATVLGRLLSKNTPVVMGVLNITPDSFSDGGRFMAPEAAFRQARRLIGEGADIIDIGAESTRPYGGMQPVSLEEELARLEPVLSTVIAMGVPVSIDTIKAEVALWALGEGAVIVNDVWGLQRDPNMARVAAEHRAPVVIMHNRDQADASIDIVADIDAFFTRSIALADAAGIGRDSILLDPGIGFGKTPEQSMAAIQALGSFKKFGLPLLVGASRKRFISTVSPSEPMDRIGGSLAAHVIAFLNGAAVIRTHDVAVTIQALRVARAIRDIKGQRND